jgi:hypothetical protein
VAARTAVRAGWAGGAVKHHLPPQRTGRQWAAIVRELAVPAPFTQAEFRAHIERHTHRVLELIPAVMRPGAPSGTWLRTARADYFYYEEQTSRFHQGHIMLFLAAHVLLGDPANQSVDLRLMPDVSPHLARIMLTGTAGNPVTELEAETFAFMALEYARRAAYPQSLARRAVQHLQPLHSALREAAPEAMNAAACGLKPSASFRLHQQVIQIRDAALALRPYRDPQVALTATHAGRIAGLAGPELAAMVEASVLSAAIRAKGAGQPVRNAPVYVGRPPVAGPDLRSETACLVKVSRAFDQLRKAGDPERGDAGESRPDGFGRAGARRPRTVPFRLCFRLDGGDVVHER